MKEICYSEPTASFQMEVFSEEEEDAFRMEVDSLTKTAPDSITSRPEHHPENHDTEDTQDTDESLSLSHLDNDSLALILEYAGMASAQLFAQSLSRTWTNRLTTLPRLAHRLFGRQGFSTEDVLGRSISDAKNDQQEEVWRECQRRQRLENALLPHPPKRSSRKHNNKPKRTSSHSHSLSLPDRCFGFVPVLPDDWEVNSYAYNDDAPPVHFDCDSFWLTSSGTSGEVLFLNPFSTRVSVCAMTASSSSSLKTTTVTPPPQQILFDTADYFDIDLKDYFPHLWDNHHPLTTTHNAHLHNHHPDDIFLRMNDDGNGNDSGDDNIDDDDEQEFDVSYIGIEAKPVWNVPSPSDNPNNQPTSAWICPQGTMAAVGRILSATEDSFPHLRHHNSDLDEDTSLKVTEIIAWFRASDEHLYAHRHCCRFRGGFFHMDVCPTRKWVYVNPWKAPNSREWVMDGDLGRPPTGSDRIMVYPLVPEQAGDTSVSENANHANNYFPNPLTHISCREAVTGLQVSPEGTTVVIATVRGHLQIWNMTHPNKPQRMASISCTKALDTAYQNSGRNLMAGMEDTSTGDAMDDIPNNGNNSSTPSFHHPSPIEEIFVSRHLPIDQAGFVSMQYHPRHGSTLLLWKRDKYAVDTNQWCIRAKINLPLTSSRFPKVHFDGRKIVVLGEDHIGYMILVYKVIFSNDDLTFMDSLPTTKMGEEGSGNVTNFATSSSTSTPAMYFAGCIRHAGLGGFQSYDPLYMTCNERFVIVSTKSGHHTGGSLQFLEDDQDSMVYSYSEGLLIIDLEKAEKKDAGYPFMLG